MISKHWRPIWTPAGVWPKIVAEALQTTWLLKGKLKSAQIAYLKIGELLVKIRDQKLDSALSHPSLEDYAEKRLKLGKSSLRRSVVHWRNRVPRRERTRQPIRQDRHTETVSKIRKTLTRHQGKS